MDLRSTDVYGVCALWDVETGTMQQAPLRLNLRLKCERHGMKWLDFA